MKTRAGQIDLSGETVGKIEVLRHVRLAPQIAYEVKCKDCGSYWSGITNQDLKNNPKCQNKGCGKKYFRTWREEHEHEQAEELSKLEAQYKNSANQLARAECEALRRMPDPEFMISRNLRAILATPSLIADTRAYTEQELGFFLDFHPNFDIGPENTKALTDYLLLNGVGLPCDFETFDRAFCRLYPLGMLRVKQPAPPPEPESETQPVHQSAPEEPVNALPLMERGIDLETGLPRDYSPREVNRMDATTYRKAFFTTANAGLSKRALNLVDVLAGRR